MVLQIVPSEATLGAVVSGVPLASLDDETFDTIERAWHEHAVLVFPEQHLLESEQVVFSRRFGSLERSLTANTTGADPEIIVLSNIREDGTLWAAESEWALFLKGNNYWHTDSSYKRVPAKGSALAARTVTDVGGETSFADMRAAYDALDPDMQRYLSDKVAVHSHAYSQGKVGGMKAVDDAEWDALPPVEHPVIRRHPATGRRSLYVGRHASHMVGANVETSRALLEQLCAEACQPQRTYTHRWQVGDLVLWDNRCVLHRGNPYPADQARHMTRTTIAGEDDGNEWSLGA
jgi:alpha-ketoglutarate-dependent taurine dioxygenase